METTEQLFSSQALHGYSPNEPLQEVFYNYKTQTQDLSLEGVFTLNNIRFHKSKTGINLYGFAGVGGTIYDTKVNALNSDGVTPYKLKILFQVQLSTRTGMISVSS
ncbi:MAG: hypothetical protein WDO19_23070 [Bacteroidota bacterium]